MSLLEKYVKFISKFTKIPVSAALEYTDEQIDQMEAQGIKVSHLRQAREEAVLNKQNAALEREKLDAASLAAVNISMLDSYLAAPRDVTSQFVIDAAEFNKQSKDKWKTEFANAPIVYGAIVQAHNALWKPGANFSTGIVFLFSMDEKRMHDKEWLKETVSKIMDMKNGNDVPKDCEKFMKSLRNHASYFCHKLGESLAGETDTWCATYTLDDDAKKLPLGYLPACKILPLAIMEAPKENKFAQIELIPLKYYSK